MENTILVALSHQSALKRQMGIIANNIANANTTAFKSQTALFTESLFKEQSGPGISFVEDFGTVRNLDEGIVVNTTSPYDMALSGSGYFVIETKTGQRYTRDGHFHLNDEREMVTKHGDPVLDIDGRPILLPEEQGNVTVTSTGTVTTELGEEPQILQVVTFDDEQSLRKVTGGYYRTTQTPKPSEDAKITQFMLENSNVNSIVEMTNMIQVHRAYESSNKLGTTDHDLQRRMIERLPVVRA
jgi:flagellar basal-body rod protein FlgF|tara:strand:+ start:225 stop:950 length:726 start_codon:yes stop_codon:yes gene_type:complete